MRYIILLFILSSCGANYHLRKAEKHLKKAEQLGATWRIDTVYKEIPFYVDSVRVDSVFVAQVGDTVVIEKDRLKLKYVRLPGDSVYIEAKCEADTIYQRVPIIVNKEIEAKSNWLMFLMLGIVIGGMALVSFRRLTS